MKKVLLLGGTNLVGPHIIRELLECGHDITVCTRGNKKNIYAKEVKSIFVDTNQDVEGVKREFGGKAFDVIVDNIAYDAVAVRNILSNVECDKYIQISSIAVYHYHHNLCEEEFDSYNFKDYDRGHTQIYMDGKQAAECVAFQEFGEKQKVAIVRPAFVTDISRPEHPGNGRIPWFVDRILADLPISPECLEYDLAFTLANEEAKLIGSLVENNRIKGVFNIACPSNKKIIDIIRYVEKKTGKKAILGETREKTGFPEIRELSLNIDRINNLGVMTSEIDDWLWELLDYYIDTKRNRLNG